MRKTLFFLSLPTNSTHWQTFFSSSLSSTCRLVQGCSLLLVGSIADFAGSRAIYLSGCFLLGIFILASGLAQTGIQLIIFRAFQGAAISLCLPTSVSIITKAFPNGQRRNIGFACLGLGQPLGYSVGLVLGGFFVDSIGWRFGYYLCAGATVIVFGVGLCILPADRHHRLTSWRSLVYGIDWVGAAIASCSLGMLSFVFAYVLITFPLPPNMVNFFSFFFFFLSDY